MAGGTDGLSLNTRLLQKLNGDVPMDWSSCSIFKVPTHLRRINEQAYEPQVVSIGPYHHGKDQLKPMEVHKRHNLKMLLNRRKESGLERYVTKLKAMEETARKFYSEPLNHIGGEEFVEMMLLDGCFIIELIRNIAMKGQRDENDQPLTPLILNRAMLDLLLVENQLPFFILSELFTMTVMPNEPRNFVAMAIDFLKMVFIPPEHHEISGPKNQDIKHLLGLLHDCWTSLPDCREDSPRSRKEDPESLEEGRSLSPEAKLNLCSSRVVRSSPPEPSEEVRSPLLKGKDALEAEPPTRRSPLKSSAAPSTATHCDNELDSDRNWKERLFISSATDLRKAGINFKKTEERLFDIKFEKGVMSIPTLRIDDNAETFFRNLVAYEQCFKDATSKCFTNYITFMDRLINTWEDVELLSHNGVIDNWLGNHGAVAAIFNKLGDNVLISKEDFCYAETFKKVNKHCHKKRNQWKAYLLHNYFNTPWAAIAAFAAVLGLLLSVLNSVFTVLSYLSN